MSRERDGNGYIFSPQRVDFAEALTRELINEDISVKQPKWYFSIGQSRWEVSKKIGGFLDCPLPSMDPDGLCVDYGELLVINFHKQLI